MELNNFNALIARLHDDADQPISGNDLQICDMVIEHATAGPWAVGTSNSYRRISTRYGDGDVIHGVAHADGQGDLSGPNVRCDMQFTVAARTLLPRAVRMIRQMEIDTRAKLEAEAVLRRNREHEDAREIGRLRAELKAARELLTAREGVLEQATDNALDGEADVHALRLENAKLRAFRDRVATALGESGHA